MIWVAAAVSEDINEKHALVVIDPAQASANGHDDVSHPRVDVYLNVRRVLHLLHTPFL